MKNKVCSVQDVFKSINGKVEYAVLKNLRELLPCNYDGSQDIDIIVKAEHKNELIKILLDLGFKIERHPWDFGNNFIFLYGMERYVFMSNGFIRLDICCELSCRSITHIEWLPLDQIINKSVWENRIFDKVCNMYMLGEKEELIHLITKSVYDKMYFTEEYKERIEVLMRTVNEKDLIDDLRLVFFSFAPRCVEMIKEGKYDSIRAEYLAYTKY